MTKNKWFKPGKPLNWHYRDSSRVRRQNVIKSRPNDLSRARALQSLANVTKKSNPKVSKVAQNDANYFFKRHKQNKL